MANKDFESLFKKIDKSMITTENRLHFAISVLDSTLQLNRIVICCSDSYTVEEL